MFPCRLRSAIVNIPIFFHYATKMNNGSKKVTSQILNSEAFISCVFKMTCVMKSKFTRIVGISAPQVGHELSIVAFRDFRNYACIKYVCNPQITIMSNDLISLDEGCLSHPNLKVTVKRPGRVRVEGRDLSFAPFSMEALGETAAIIQHEVDHLEGRPWPPKTSITNSSIYL